MVENQSTSIRKYPKRIPYGMMNFKAVIEDNCYYVDKTPFVEKIERANKFFFYLRPRRFGKSLTLSMLDYNKLRMLIRRDKEFAHDASIIQQLVQQDYITGELKYAKSKDTDAHIQQLFKEAEVQVNRYAQSEVVTSAVKTTQLHKIVVIYRGTEMVVCEEVNNQ